ncbi:MAG TPA: hypothetical protein VFU89_05410 [Rhabdochlamydiaceae bacterium]|nr:hypothetical protein [Rhabdochlamydiaceae bacterium]
MVEQLDFSRFLVDNIAAFSKENMMAGKVVLGLTTRPISKIWCSKLYGDFSHRSFSTAQKTTSLLLKKPAMTESECQIHNSKIPSYDQIKKSPQLQQKLAKMHEGYATDPDFQEMTMDSMKWALRSLGKEKH